MKLLPETKRLAKQQAAARGKFLYEYLDWLVQREVTGIIYSYRGGPPIDVVLPNDTVFIESDDTP